MTELQTMQSACTHTHTYTYTRIHKDTYNDMLFMNVHSEIHDLCQSVLHSGLLCQHLSFVLILLNVTVSRRELMKDWVICTRCRFFYIRHLMYT